MMNSSGYVMNRCGCRDPQTGRPLARNCPLLKRPGHGSWYLVYELPPDACGHRRRIRQGGYQSRRAAAEMLERLRNPGAEPAAGRVVATGQWLTIWLASRYALRPATLRSYTSHVRRYLEPHLSQIPLTELNVRHLRAMFAIIVREHDAAGHPLTAASLCRIRATLRVALNAAIREGHLRDNPARHVELPTPRRPHPVVWTASRIAEWQATRQRPAVAVWTAAQTAQFLSSIRDHQLYAAFHLIWVTEGTVEKHVRSILTKLDLPETDDDHRRVLAVLTYLDSH